jgi:hypothetical protein
MKDRQEKAAYASRTIRTFLDETCGPYDWDDFTSCALKDPSIDSIQLRAGTVELPVDAEGRIQLLALADEADRLANDDVS